MPGTRVLPGHQTRPQGPGHTSPCTPAEILQEGDARVLSTTRSSGNTSVGGEVGPSAAGLHILDSTANSNLLMIRKTSPQNSELCVPELRILVLKKYRIWFSHFRMDRSRSGSDLKINLFPSPTLILCQSMFSYLKFFHVRATFNPYIYF